MTAMIRQFLMLTAGAGACSLQAIEPPVEAQPIPPRDMPAEKSAEPPRALEVVPDFAAPEDLVIPPGQGVNAERPYIGVILDPVPEILSGHLQLATGEGLVIRDVVAGGPAAMVGLVVNDIITRVNGEVVGTPEQVRLQVEKYGVGDPVTLEVIHDGKRSEVPLVLGAAPDRMPGAPQEGMAFGGGDELEEFLGNFPEKHADLMRQAMEQGLQGFGQLGEDAGLPDNWHRDLLKRRERRMGAGGKGLDFGNFQAESSIRLLDDQGSIEMKGADGSKNVRAFDKAGNLVWEGPYNTEEDKAAAPDDIRKRIDQVDLNMDYGGSGIHLRGGPQRFRPLDEIAPGSLDGQGR